MSAPIAIDPSRCTGCGLCVKGCGFEALRLVEAPGANKLGRLAAVDEGACRACSACVNACKFKAISEVKREVVGTTDLDSYRDIWVFAEQTDGKIAEVAFELLTKGLELKAQRGNGCRLAAVLLGHALSDALIDQLSAVGADLVYVVDDPALAQYEPGVYTDALASLAKKYRPEVILAGATAIGRAFFARVAARLRTGLTADCTALKVEATENKTDGRTRLLLHQSRPAFGGNIMATIMTPNHRPQMATVRPKVFKKEKGKRKSEKGQGKSEKGQGRELKVGVEVEERRLGVEVIREEMRITESKVRTVEVVRDPDSVDITAAEVLVAGGRGLKNALNFVKLHELAGLLHGEVAASRAAVDAGWTTARRQVGQTGRTVAPRIYLAFGISGAIQHLEGIRGADRIIAVNNDPKAPIFDIADLGIVGDALEVIDTLIKELKK